MASDAAVLDEHLHSPQRRLIELRMAHADLDELIDRHRLDRPSDEPTLRQLKKRRLPLRDRIVQPESQPDPPEPA